MTSVRLKKRSEYLHVQGKGRRFKGRHLVLLVAPRDGAQQARIGFTVSRKVGNAVIRNRVRRRLKEAIRAHEEALCPGCDHVIIAFSTAATSPFRVLVGDLLETLERARA